MNINLPSKKHLAVAVVITVLVAGAVSAAVWKYQSVNHGPTYSQLQAQNAKLAKENASLHNQLTEASNTKNQQIQKLTADKAALCDQTRLARLPRTVCTQ